MPKCEECGAEFDTEVGVSRHQGHGHKPYMYEETLRELFRQWMSVCQALGYCTSAFREKDMDGQANKFKAINETIAEGLAND